MTFKALIFIISLFVFSKEGFSQNSRKDLYKKYVQTDSSSNKASVLLLYTDNTFINYGTLNDIYNTEYHVWFTSGKWDLANGEIVCNSVSNLFERNKLINDIKLNHKARPDHRLYDSYYEFVDEKFTNYSFVIIKNKAIDLNKKIEYKDIQSNESPINN